MNCKHEWTYYDKKNSIAVYRVCTKCKCAQKRIFGSPRPRDNWRDVSTTAIVALALDGGLCPVSNLIAEAFERLYP